MLTKSVLDSMTCQNISLFDRVISRMTADELLDILYVYRFVLSKPYPLPTWLTAEGLFTYLDWNNGEGDFYSTSPYKYSGGLYVSDQNAMQIRNTVKQHFEDTPATFLANFSDARALELVTPSANAGLDASTPVTKIVAWSAPALATATTAHPEIAYYSNGGVYPLSLRYFQGDLLVYDEVAAAYKSTIATIVTALLALPAGSRYFRCNRYQDGNTSAGWSDPHQVNGGWRECIFNRDYDSPSNATDSYALRSKGLSMETWKTNISAADSKIKTFIAALRARAVVVLGAADADTVLDGLIMDVERRPASRALSATKTTGTLASGGGTAAGVLTMSTSAHGIGVSYPFDLVWTGGERIRVIASAVSGTSITFSLGSGTTLPANATAITTYVSSGLNDTWRQLFADADWATMRDSKLKPTKDQTYYDTFKEFTYNSHPYTDQRAMVFDAAVTQYYDESLAVYAQLWLDVFPNMDIHNYDSQIYASGTIYRRTNPYFNGQAMGMGSLVGTGAVAIVYGDRDGSYPARWNTITQANETLGVGNTTAELQFGSLVCNVSQIRSTIAASRSDNNVWLSMPDGSGIDNQLGTDGLYNEMILHAALLTGDQVGTDRRGGGIHFYNSGVSNDNHLLFFKLINERDTVLLFTKCDGAAVIEPNVPSLLPAFLISTFQSGNGTMVHRVTPNPSSTTTLTTDGTTNTFTNSVGSVVFENSWALPIGYSFLGLTEIPLGAWVISYPQADPDNLTNPVTPVPFSASAPVSVPVSRTNGIL